MEQNPVVRPKGARRAATAPPALADGPAQPAAAPQRRRSSGAAKAKAPLSKKGSSSEETREEAAPGGRDVSPKKGALKPEACGPAGGSNSPAGDKAAAQKKRKGPARAKAGPQKAEVASGADSREEKHVPEEEDADRETAGAIARGRRAPPEEGAAKAKEPGPGAAEAVPRARAAARRSPLREVLQSLVLRKQEVGDATKQVNDVRDLLIKAIKKQLYLSALELLGAGSFFEHLKITKPDEFDIMFTIPDVRVVLEPCNDDVQTGACYFVTLKRNPELKKLYDFIDDKQYLSASKILSALRTIISKEVKTINGMNVTVERKKPGSPAVTLQIGESPSQISIDIILALEMYNKTLPDGQRVEINVEKWLGRNERRELEKKRLYLVPKNAKDGKKLIDTWRLSFSHIEKAIIKNHGNGKTCCGKHGTKCCRRECLKLLKHLLEQLKTKHENRNQFAKFCSYHAKTAFFHTCNKWTMDQDWLETNLEECFERLLDYFLDCLRKVELQHFFIPTCNLFSDDMKCHILAKVIEKERANDFPIFKQT